MLFGLRGELGVFALVFNFVELCGGTSFRSVMASSRSGIILEVVSSNLMRFERHEDGPGTSSSNSVTEEWKGLE